ncbi:hypothetical protein ACFWOG_17495 [Kitasatospora sp. NPDC058406]|uniref:hypothetical protein n=1 Tax=Kitasatospora sp. NPDC058406 TaxID=3346483 RepID=UPI00364B2A37
MSSIPVTVVGPRSSGKTVYLASLFARLSQQDPELGFSVTLPLGQSQQLNAVYEQVVGPGDWPIPSTPADFPVWDFTCTVSTPARRRLTPFAVSYVDYSGELLTQGDLYPESLEKLDRLMTASPFLLILLDGERVLRFLAGDNRLISEYRPVFSHLGANQDAVVHFVLTKWDLLEAAGHTLEQVADRLCATREFRLFVDGRRALQGDGGVIRLIPVSSVGRGFARLDENGHVVKTPGARPDPLDVEVPFMAVVVDLFTTELRKYTRARENPAVRAPGNSEGLLRIFRRVSAGMPLVRAFLATRATRNPLLKTAGEVVVDALAEYVDEQARRHGRRIEESAAQLRRAVEQAATDQQALVRIAKAFQARLEEFEDEHPGSRLDLWTARA